MVGRLATQLQNIIRGKVRFYQMWPPCRRPTVSQPSLSPHCGVLQHKPTYLPNADCGDNVVVINAKELVLTGNKWKDKL